jgi:hypothetical protein
VRASEPRRACDQRPKIVAIAAYPTDWCCYRIGATGMNARLANDPPGWTAKELLDELLTSPVRIAAFKPSAGGMAHRSGGSGSVPG